MVISEIKKEHGVIVFSFNDMDGKTVSINVLDGTITSYTGRSISSMPKGLNAALSEYALTKNSVVGGRLKTLISRYVSSRNSTYLKILDVYFSNFDVLDLIYTSVDDIPTTLPKGFIKYLKDNNTKANKKNLARFSLEVRIKNWSEENQELYKLMREKARYYDDLLELDDDKIFVLLKILKTHMKIFSWTPQQDMHNYFSLIFDSDYDKNKYKWWEVADTNRGFLWNYDNFKNILNAERNKKVMEWQSNFKEIEQLSNDILTIIVPTTQEQFTDEGRQQNNCVGSYYHDSMSVHNNIIYFIRKKNRPNKSYITNRYAVRGNWLSNLSTVESRAVNNSNYLDENVTDLIKEIDIMITKIIDDKHLS